MTGQPPLTAEAQPRALGYTHRITTGIIRSVR